VWPHPPPLKEAPPEDPRDPTMTPTEVKLRSAFFDPHSGQSGLFSSEYWDMDILTSKVPPQSGQR